MKISTVLDTVEKLFLHVKISCSGLLFKEKNRIRRISRVGPGPAIFLVLIQPPSFLTFTWK